jgi:transcriptional regulator with XRE-family HTH domain/tetratricopeptide (TPR) repeat protein
MNMAHTAPFGDLLRRYRVTAGLTQEELAEKAGLSAKGISDLERGARQHPRRETLRLLVDALNLTDRDRAMFEAAARSHRTANGTASGIVGGMASGEHLARRQLGGKIPLVGRHDALRQVDAQLSGDDTALLLLLAGEPGIGKSRLLAEAALRATEQGWSVLGGGCHRRSGQEPFAPFVDLLEHHLASQPAAERRLYLRGCRWLVRLLPELTEALSPPENGLGLPPEQQQRLMFAAVARYLTNVAGPTGTLLILDDLQWAGQDALDLLAFLLRTARGDRTMRVIAAYRDTEVRSHDPFGVLVADLAREALTARTLLAPLTVEQSAEMLDLLLIDTADASAFGQAGVRQQLLDRTGGIPFFLVSSVQSLHAGAANEGGVNQYLLPWSVAESVRQRVGMLTPAAQELLNAAAVAGRTIGRDLLIMLAQRLGHDERVTIAAVESACQARLLVEDSTVGYAFSHDLIREVIVADMSAARRAVLHLHIAEALTQSTVGQPAELLAYHFSSAGLPARAITFLEQAADQALAMYANTEAAALYRQLVALLVELRRPLEASRAGEKLGGVLLALARYDEALEVLESAMSAYRAAHDVEGVARLTGQIAFIHANRGTALEGIETLKSLIASVEADAPPAALAGMYTLLAELYWASARGPDLLTVARRGLDYARATDDAHLRNVAEGRVGHALILSGRTEEGVQTLASALPAVESFDDLWQTGRITENMALAREAQGDFALALQGLERAVAIADRIGDQGARVYIRYRRGMLEYYRGMWDRARDDFASGMSIGTAVHGEAVSAFPLFGLGLLDRAMGHRAVGEQQMEEALTRATRYMQLRLLRPMSGWLAECDLVEQRPQAALARLELVLHGAEHTEELETTHLLPLQAWAHLVLDDLKSAEGIAELAFQRAIHEGNRLALADVLRIRAVIFARQDRRQQALGALEEALQLARQMRYPYAEAKALYVSGQLHATRSDPESARHQMEMALAILMQLRERLYAEHIERALTHLPS